MSSKVRNPKTIERRERLLESIRGFAGMRGRCPTASELLPRPTRFGRVRLVADLRALAKQGLIGLRSSDSFGVRASGISLPGHQSLSLTERLDALEKEVAMLRSKVESSHA